MKKLLTYAKITVDIDPAATMPHAVPSIPFQAIILCGPGSSFPTFNTNPDQYPKVNLAFNPSCSLLTFL